MINTFPSKKILKANFASIEFLVSFSFLVVILFIRLTRGIDLTDEMQYYGQIKGLLVSGELFSNDLFIQQSVYILFYPIFYLYHSIFGYDGFVFLGRLLLAGLSIGVFIYSYLKFRQFKFSNLISSLTAFSLTFSVPYHGVFSPSYNTISQLLWIIFTIRFLEWKKSNYIGWGVIPILTAFCHPTSAILMTGLIFIRLSTELDYKRIKNIFVISFICAVCAIIFALCFSTVQGYLNSLAFSSGFGVGTSFFSVKNNSNTLLAIYLMFGFSLVVQNFIRNINLVVLLSLGSLLSLYLLATGYSIGAYTYRSVYILASLTALSYLIVIRSRKVSDLFIKSKIHWLTFSLLAYATTLAVTSSNGIGQASGAFMIGLPLLIAVFLGVDKGEDSLFFKVNKHLITLLLPVLFISHWITYPYRESTLFELTDDLSAIPEFRFIHTSPDRASFIQNVKFKLSSKVQNKRTLIVSEYPGLYFILNAEPETCMLYMHSLTSEQSEQVLLECLDRKKPEVVIDIDSNRGYLGEGNARIKQLLKGYYAKNSFNCVNEDIKFHPDKNYNQINYTLCNIQELSKL